MRLHSRFSPKGTGRRLVALENRTKQRFRTLNARLFLWLYQYLAAGIMPPQAWLLRAEVGQAVRDAVEAAFLLGWREADAEVEQARRGNAPKRFAKWPNDRFIPQAEIDQLLSKALLAGQSTVDARIEAAQGIIRADMLTGGLDEQGITALVDVLMPWGMPGTVPGAPAGTSTAVRTAEGAPGYKAERLTRTAVMDGYNAGRLSRQQNETTVTGWRWSTAMDTRVCPICQPREGLFIPVGEEVGQWPPIHWGCRCVTIPVFDFEDQPDQEQYVSSKDGLEPPMDGFGDPLKADWLG